MFNVFFTLKVHVVCLTYMRLSLHLHLSLSFLLPLTFSRLTFYSERSEVTR
jgi:hypothetical protein